MNKAKYYFDIFNELIDLIDFEIEKTEKGYKLVDLQGANLGNIEGDVFDDIVGIIDRLTVYIDDYIVNDLCEGLKINKYSFYNYARLLETVKTFPKDKQEEHEFDIEVLDMVIEAPSYDFFYDEKCISKYLKYKKV